MGSLGIYWGNMGSHGRRISDTLIGVKGYKFIVGNKLHPTCVIYLDLLSSDSMTSDMQFYLASC